jgi:2-polyprenyl-6-methoxyphenol hydroxylase-like FAD-dependent oxidoreductase
MATTQALVIGAGPTGMTAAIELRRAGVDVRIIDRGTQLARWSQALVVQARTLEQFQRYGIAEKAVERGHPLQGARLFSGNKEIAHMHLERIQSRYPYLLFLPQSETEALLNEYMESLGVKTERGMEMVSLASQGDEATVRVKHGDGKSEDIQTRWVIGCDGAHSAVREMCGIPFEGHGVSMHFFLADLEVEGPDRPTDELVVRLLKGDVLFMAPLSEKLTRVIVAKHEEQHASFDETPQQGRTGGQGKPLSIADFQNAIDTFGVKLRVVSSAWMTPFYVNDRQAAHYRSGNIFLAGDASHIHSPVGGQGMNTGIQDAANLCWKIAAAERGSSAKDKLLDSYEQERVPVGKALLALTERALKLTTTESAVVSKLRDLIAPHVTRLGWVQRSGAGFISETAIEYRRSPVVQDHGGDGEVHAGDRMPDVDLVGGPGGKKSLLGGWKDGRHLAVAMEAADGFLSELKQSLPGAGVVALRAADLDEHGRRLLGARPGVFVVRPDGYVGFRGALEKAGELQGYARQDAIASTSSLQSAANS